MLTIRYIVLQVRYENGVFTLFKQIKRFFLTMFKEDKVEINNENQKV